MDLGILRASQALKYGAKAFQVMARIDNKTTPICRSMHGRIISAKHLSAQANKVLEAQSIADKKAASTWMSEPFLAKDLPHNFGLPPYHFRCRTEVVPVWIQEEHQDGVKVRYTDKQDGDYVRHIDKIGVERYLTQSNYKSKTRHTDPLHKRATKAQVVSMLNSITQIAPHANNHTKSIATTQNGFIIIFKNNEIDTYFKSSSKQEMQNYFKNNAKYHKKEIIKWHVPYTLQFARTLLGR